MSEKYAGVPLDRDTVGLESILEQLAFDDEWWSPVNRDVSRAQSQIEIALWLRSHFNDVSKVTREKLLVRLIEASMPIITTITLEILIEHYYEISEDLRDELISALLSKGLVLSADEITRIKNMMSHLPTSVANRIVEAIKTAKLKPKCKDIVIGSTIDRMYEKDVYMFLNRDEYIYERTSYNKINEIVEEEFKKQISQGKILFNPPKEMILGVKERIEARIAKMLIKEEMLLKGLKGRGDPCIEEIKVSPIMKVDLKGDNFEIEPLHDAKEQMIVDGEYTQWSWNVTPLKEGIQWLLLTATVVIFVHNYDKEIKKEYTVFEKQIMVRVDQKELFKP